MNSVEIIDKIVELKATTSLLGFMHTAFAEGAHAVNMQEAAEALYEIYNRQNSILTEIISMINDVRGEKQ